MGRYDMKKSEHDEGAVRTPAPTGFYTFQITDFKEKGKEGNWLETKNGDPKIYVICEVVNHKEHDGKNCLHTLTFYKPDSPSIKGIGITRHFLSCIGEPFEGDIVPEPDNWIGKQFQAEVVQNGDYLNLADINEVVGGLPKDESKPVDDTIAWDD